MYNEKTPLHGAPSDINETQPVGIANDSEGDAPPPRDPRPPRGDKGKLHRRRNGLLSKHPLQVLARKGENIRDICRQELELRAELRPQGALGKILFDRLWSSYLRCLLIDRTEAELLSPDEQHSTRSTPLPTLRVDYVPTLVYENVVAPDGICAEILKYLAITQRYDAHYSNDFYRNLGLLLAHRNGGVSGLTDELLKTSGSKINLPEAFNA
jgi:hypothetical protein